MTISPEPPDDAELFALLEAQFEDTQPPDVENVQAIPLPELAGRLKAVDRELSEMGELLEKGPGTERGRELHSQRNALLIEMRRRGLR